MDWNPERRREKCHSRPQKGLVNGGSVLDLQPPRENVDELLELLSLLSEDLTSSPTSPVNEEKSRNACRSGSIQRQRNVFSQVELTAPKSSHILPAREGTSSTAAHSETISTKPRTVRFADLERLPATPSRPCNPVDRDTLHVQMDSEKHDNGGYWQTQRQYSIPASTTQLHRKKVPEKSQNILSRDAEFDAPPSELSEKLQAHFNRDRTDSCCVDYTGDLREDEAESVSELQSLLESSWTSASLHRSMLDLEISEQLLMFELGPLSPKAEGDSSHLHMPESATEDSSDVSASHNANMLCPFFQCQQRKTSCYSGKIDSKAGPPVTCQENQVTNPLHHSDTVTDSRPSSELVRPHSVRTLNSSRVPMVLSHNESGYCSQHQAGGTEDAYSVCTTASEQFLDMDCNTCQTPRKALFQHGFCSGETATKTRFCEDRAKLCCRSLIQEESRFDKQKAFSYSQFSGTRNVNPSLAVYHMTESTEVPHFLFGKERLITKENLIKDSCEITTGEVRRSLMCPQDCGDGPTTFAEKRLGRKNGRTSLPHALSGTFSNMDHRSVAQPSSTMCAFKEGAFCDSDGNPGDKRKEVVPGGKGLTADHQFWRLPDAAEVWSSDSVVTVEQRWSRFLARCRSRLLSRCLQTWSHRHRCQTAARCQHGRWMLEKGFSALKWAVTMRHMQTDAMATRRHAALLSRCFGHWKACSEQRQFSAVRPSLDTDVNVEALRRRLLQPSDGLVLRTAYCAWRRHFQGLQLFRAAHMHYHLTLLFKHWLEWRRRKMIREARVQLGQAAELQCNGWLKRRALITWRWAQDKACQAQAHHRACCLAAVWRRWAELVHRAWERLRLERRSQGFHRRALLQPSLCHWRARAQQQRTAREKRHRIARMAVLCWKSTVKRRRLGRLCYKVEQLLVKGTLSAAFGKWRQAKSSAALEQTQVREGRHLLARRRLQAAFSTWHRGSGVRRAAWALQRRVQKAQLIHCLQAWRSVAAQRSERLRCCTSRRALSARRCLQHWRHALELRRLHLAFITRAFQRRRQRARGRRAELRWGVGLSGETEPVGTHQWRPYSSEDLLLHQAFHTWRDSTRNLQLARVYHVTKELQLVRAALQCWHRLAQQALDAQVHSFCVRLAQLDSAGSLGSESTSPVCLFLGVSARSEQRAGGARAPAPPHGAVRLPDQSGLALNGSRRLKSVAVSALARIRRGPVAVAFCQWRALLRTSRGQRALLDSVREVRTRSELSWAFRTWRTGTQSQAAAHKHWERRLLAGCMAQWRGAVCLQRGQAVLQREAQHFHTNTLLTRCFSTWLRRGRVKLMLCEPENAARLERRVAWLLRRAEKRRLRVGFALWAARVRQNLAVHLYRRQALLTRVFVAWETWAWLDQERKALVLQRMRARLCRAALDHWRSHTQQLQEIRRRRANRLELQAREILRCWHSYAQNKSGLWQLLCEHLERRRRMMKRRALLSWAEGTERLRMADVSALRSLKIRYLQQWHCRAVCGARFERGVAALEEERAHRALCSAFLLWRECWQHAEQRLLGRVRAAACCWRQRALQGRAETHHAARLASRALLRWRHAQARRRERRRRVQGVARAWLQLARRGRSLQEEALAFQLRRQRSRLASGFTCWVAAYRSSVTSVAFHSQQQGRRVLLAWRRVTVVTLTHRSLAVGFRAGCQERLAASCFSRWLAALRQARGRLLILHLGLCSQRQRAGMAAMQHWRTATRGRLVLRNLNKSRLQKLFGCWKEKTEAMKAADVLCVERGRRGARSALGMWLRWATETKARRQMGEAVWLWVRGRSVSGTFYLWARAYRHNKEASQLSCTRLLQRCLCEWRLAVKAGWQVLCAAEERVHTQLLLASFSSWRKRMLSQQALHTNIQQAKARWERRLLCASLRAWHQQAEAQKCHSLNLSKKYLCLWVQHGRKQCEVKQSEVEDLVESRLSQKYLRRWRMQVLERRFVGRCTRLLWTSWRSQAAAAGLLRYMSDQRLQKWVWLTWRKRRIRTRVSVAFAAHHSRVLLAQAFGAWRDRTLCPTSQRSVASRP